MATVFDEVSIKGLRKSHFEQLLAYLDKRDRTGWYYGNKKQFEKRHEDLKEWLSDIYFSASKEGIIIPKKNKPFKY